MQKIMEPYVKKIMDENRGCKYGCGAMGAQKFSMLFKSI
jgi:hypothetical protein